MKKEISAAVTVLLFAAAAASCAFGAYHKEADTVFKKAANVCMECIGLG